MEWNGNSGLDSWLLCLPVEQLGCPSSSLILAATPGKLETVNDTLVSPLSSQDTLAFMSPRT